jgi:hypothetical protein
MSSALPVWLAVGRAGDPIRLENDDSGEEA